MSNVKVKAPKKPVKPVIVVIYILLVILAVYLSGSASVDAVRISER